MKAEKGKLSSFDFDLRVRERNLAKGIIDPKALERYLTELSDVEANAEAIGVAQPALDEDDVDDDDADSSLYGSE